jgi:uncharacterized membrane protein (DUF2068 family)
MIPVDDKSPGPVIVPQKHHKGLIFIGIFKLVKVFFLVVGGSFAAHYMKFDPAARANNYINLHQLDKLDTDKHLVYWVLTKVANMDEHTWALITILTFTYAILYTFEGVGLVLEKKWGEVLTIVTTTLLMPLELLEIVKKPNPIRISLLLLNGIILVYVLWQLKQKYQVEKSVAATVNPTEKSQLDAGFLAQSAPSSPPRDPSVSTRT